MPLTNLNEIGPDKSNVLLSPERLLLEVPQGLYHSMAIIMLITWYISSGATLFSNKYILSQLNGDALLLGIQKKTIFVLYLLLSFKVQINLLYL
jgi:hypothetical protein